MTYSRDAAEPELAPWDSALAARVQPVLSALFHDIMGPLSLIKNRTYLIRRNLVGLQEDPALDDAARARVAAVIQLLDGVDEASHRIHRGMAVPRDAIWAAVLEGESFDPRVIIDQIAQAMKGNGGSEAVTPGADAVADAHQHAAPRHVHPNEADHEDVGRGTGHGRAHML